MSDNWREFLKEVQEQNQRDRVESITRNAEKYGCDDACEIRIED